MELNEIVPGLVVTHYKAGGTYDVLGIARDSEDRARLLVLYYSRGVGCIWARPAREQDCRPGENPFCGTVTVDDLQIPRFMPTGQATPFFSCEADHLHNTTAEEQRRVAAGENLPPKPKASR